MLFSTNKQVACTPFPSTAIEQQTNRGFTTVKQKRNLTKLMVVFTDNERIYQEGYLAFVRGEDMNHAWANTVYEVSDKKFILVPEDRIMLVDTGADSDVPF